MQFFFTFLFVCLQYLEKNDKERHLQKRAVFKLLFLMWLLYSVAAFSETSTLATPKKLALAFPSSRFARLYRTFRVRAEDGRIKMK